MYSPSLVPWKALAKSSPVALASSVVKSGGRCAYIAPELSKLVQAFGSISKDWDEFGVIWTSAPTDDCLPGPRTACDYRRLAIADRSYGVIARGLKQGRRV